jgi:hypothetical protein
MISGFGKLDEEIILKQPVLILIVALVGAVLGAGGYAYFYTSVPSPPSTPAQITEGRKLQSANQVGQFPSFTIHPGQMDSDGLPTSNARLCIQSEAQCFTFDKGSSFGLAPKAERVKLASGGSVVFFSGISSGGGSGSLDVALFAGTKYHQDLAVQLSKLS